MTTPFAFLPRAVSKHTKEWQGISRPPPSPPDPTTDPDSDHDSKSKEKARPNQSRDVASLVSLALSDYNIWLDPDIRSKLDACLRDEPSDAGFVPINYLLRRSPFRGSLPQDTTQPEPSETEVVKALRTHASHALEVRIRLPSSAQSSSVWYGTGKTSRKKDVGGYEVRRRDWPTLRDRPSRGWSRAQWDDLTAYMECIPPQYRTVGGVACFAESLLSPPSEAEAEADVAPRLRVQRVTLPPHYLDKPGDAPKCKGYALVTFSTKSHLDAVLHAWPWRRRAPVPANDEHAVMKEAHKYGLRAISKARWDALNEEYLVYKQSLVDEVARAETDLHRPGQAAPDHERGEPTARPQAQTQTTSSSPYPFDCLVFVRNVHPGTNKTTLKSLFTQAFQDQDGSGQGHAHARTTVGLDYVDFSKGMDTCHLRLASPHHAMRLIDYFDARPKTQAHGLDAMGRTPLEDDKPIALERVRGKREELYWGKIPEKVRRQAVQAQLASGAEASSEPASNTTHPSGAIGSGQKKRNELTPRCS